MIYFTQDRNNNHIKIGFTSNSAESRRDALQTGNSSRLEVLFTMEGDQSLEASLHRQFEEANVNGEWFRPVPELIQFIIQSAVAEATQDVEMAEIVDSLEQRRIELQVLASNVSYCSRCPSMAATRTQTVFGIGPIDPELCLIGEAPGADEDAQGEPFVGAAGQFLNRILAASGLSREQVYLCNILKCRPPQNRTPEVEEAGNCSGYLQQQLELIRPKFICCLGGTAVKFLLNTSRSLGSMRQNVHDYHGIPVVCTYHPSYLLPHRSPDPKVQEERKKLVWEDMQFLIERMGRHLPTPI